jgi:hypothetical protein
MGKLGMLGGEKECWGVRKEKLPEEIEKYMDYERIISKD